MRLLFLVEVYSKRCINQLLIGSSKTRLLSNRSCKDWKCTRINRPTFEWDRAIQHPTETKRTVIWESRHLRWIPHKFPLPSPLSAFVFVFSLGCRWQFSVLWFHFIGLHRGCSSVQMFLMNSILVSVKWCATKNLSIGMITRKFLTNILIHLNHKIHGRFQCPPPEDHDNSWM